MVRVAIVAGGDVDPGDLEQLRPDDLVIAADGGAVALVAAGRRPDVLVGDFDSIPGALAAQLATDGVDIDRHPADKEASDLELAVERAISEGAQRVLIIGAFGGERLDHALAATFLLADPRYAAIDIRARQRGSTVRVAHPDRRLDLEGEVGDLVTLLPVAGDARGVTTTGLRWPLRGATLCLGRSRGLSNEVTAVPASVSLAEGALFAIETRRTGATENE
jgi:thiamine pyrophosphokinase